MIVEQNLLLIYVSLFFKTLHVHAHPGNLFGKYCLNFVTLASFVNATVCSLCGCPWECLIMEYKTRRVLFCLTIYIYIFDFKQQVSNIKIFHIFNSYREANIALSKFIGVLQEPMSGCRFLTIQVLQTGPFAYPT